MSARVLTVNGGSSSIKFALFGTGTSLRRELSGEVSRIGDAGSRLEVKRAGEKQEESQPITARDYEQAVGSLLQWLDRHGNLADLAGIGHRIVHGGPRYSESTRVTAELLEELRRIAPWDPAHLPGEIALIEAFGKKLPQAPQVACFDTAFHHDLPRVAQLLPVPRRYLEGGVRRFGFHGLSYTYLMEELRRVAGPAIADGRVILAHLGNGASMAAVRDGKCIDTTMAFTPTAGLVMGTRSGDLDPGLLIYLMRNEKLSVDQLDDLVNRQAGMLGLSERSSDMRDLLAHRDDVRSAEAVDVFCYQAAKWIGALTAALGGLDALVFAGGIGEHAPEVRVRICAPLEYLGINIDRSRNHSDATVISADRSQVQVRVIRTDEEQIIARDVCRVLEQGAAS